MDKLKILFLAANPTDTSRLKLDEEIRAIEQALRRGKYWNHFQLEQHWAVRVTDLQALLLESRPHIVHFSGHGSAESEIILQDEQGQSRPIPRQALKTLFELLKGNIHCVVLNSCYSKEQANSIAETIDCVVGMSDAIGDQAAIRFSSSFYQALAFGESVDKAFKLGCNQINLEDMKEEDKPKLITRRSDPTEIFLAQISKEVADATDISEKATAKLENGADASKIKKKNKYIPVFLLISCVFIVLVGYKACVPPNREDTSTPPEASFILPKVPPALETKIAIADFNNCPGLQSRLVTLLNKAFNNSNPTVEVKQLAVANDKFTARNMGENMDLVVWGSCGAEKKIKDVNFEIISARGTPEIYEPESLEFMPSTDEQLDRIVKGVGVYVYRDIAKSQNAFNDMAEHDFKDNPLVRLMWGNSLMFGRNYEKAIEVYAGSVESFPNKAFFHYNLGIALMNLLKNKQRTAGEYEDIEIHFNKALDVNKNFTLANIAIGLMNIMAITSHPSYYSNPAFKEKIDFSIESCGRGLSSNKDRIILLAQYCLNELKIVQQAMQNKLDNPQPDMDELKNTIITLDSQNYQADPYWSAPLIEKALVGYNNWKVNENPASLIYIKKEMEDALKQSVKNIHTEFTMERHENALDYYHLLSDGEI